MKIAVCLSGQPRTIEHTYKNILHHFSNYDVDYFCQSWNFNTYKRKLSEPKKIYWEDEKEVDSTTLNDMIQEYFKPKKSIIQENKDVPVVQEFCGLFYSIMAANFLKKQYEIENNFKYDFVVKTRYDIIFDPEAKFLLCPETKISNHLDIFVNNSSRMMYEYQRLNVNDMFFYGSSSAMDIMTSLYHWMILELQNRRSDDWENVGPGVRMTDFAAERNMIVHKTGQPWEIVYRPEAIPLDSMLQFKEIATVHYDFWS